ncbi:hypothetical protein LRS74_00500 [Streptomyces sp. LX-29]|uniref:hypothetical protein n=1 Tax=Streptomyces sp. LX-29 TaxID=2900152 RepID=UPI00240E1FD3|nr:hypothetical protein [Streptomyces sp. LX-29]WFB05660.1 hypothetical protein LRS74_00500 [Streptomyces sp. LX-29]
MTEIDYGRFHERLEQARGASVSGAAVAGGRWELLRAFQEEWGYRPTDGNRWEPEMPDAHKAYVSALKTAAEDSAATGSEDVDRSLAIPAALDEWWDLPFNSFADRPEVYETNPVWPPTVRPDPTGYGVSGGLPDGNPFTGPGEDLRVCVFMAENQYCNEWGYPAAHAHLADPQVLVSGVDEEGKPAWVPQSHSISEFLLQLAVTRLPADFGSIVEETEVAPEVVDRLRSALRPMGFLPWLELGAHTEYFGGLDVIVAHNTGYGDFELAAYGRTERALERLADTLGLDWSEEY